MKRLTSLLLVLGCLPTLADSGWYQSEFPGPQPFNPLGQGIEHPDVVMADEEVRISLGQGSAAVYADFTFRNEGPAQTVQMFFPLDSSGEMDLISEEEYGGEPEVTTVEIITTSDYGFSASVNGIKLGERILREETIQIDSEESESSFYSTHEYSNTYAIYEVPFAAGETLRLSVEYQQLYGGPKHAEWVEMYYPVYTGGSWKGPIGHGIIEVCAGEGFNWNGVWQYQSVALPSAIEKDNQLIWEFEELEPQSETQAGVRVMLPYTDEPCWGIVLAPGGINFRTLPDPAATKVSAHPLMNEGEFFTIFERQGDWWRVEDEDGNTGWLRWRYVDPDTGMENIYAAISPGKNSYHALESGA